MIRLIKTIQIERLTILVFTKLQITSHLGKNPKKGGKPPIDSSDPKTSNFNWGFKFPVLESCLK